MFPGFLGILIGLIGYFQRDLLTSTVVTYSHPEPNSEPRHTHTPEKIIRVSGVKYRSYFQRELLPEHKYLTLVVELSAALKRFNLKADLLRKLYLFFLGNSRSKRI